MPEITKRGEITRARQLGNLYLAQDNLHRLNGVPDSRVHDVRETNDVIFFLNDRRIWRSQKLQFLRECYIGDGISQGDTKNLKKSQKKGKKLTPCS